MFTDFLHRFWAQEVVACRMSPLHSMMFAVSTVSAAVSHNLEPPNHLSNAEKSEHFCSDNAGAHKRVAVEIPYAREEVLRVGGPSDFLQARGVTDSVGDGSEVALEGFDGAGSCQWLPDGKCPCLCILTAAACSFLDR